MSLIEWGQRLRIEPGILVQCSGFDVVKVDAHLSVRVADGDVEGEVEREGGVGVVEPGEGGVDDVEFDDVRTDDEPEDEDGDAEEDDDGEKEFEDEGEQAAAAATVVVVATPWAVVGFGWGDGGAVVGPVQLGLFRSHD